MGQVGLSRASGVSGKDALKFFRLRNSIRFLIGNVKKAQRIGFVSPDFSRCLLKVTVKALYTLWEDKCLQQLNHNVSLSLILFLCLNGHLFQGRGRSQVMGKFI